MACFLPFPEPVHGNALSIHLKLVFEVYFPVIVVQTSALIAYMDGITVTRYGSSLVLQTLRLLHLPCITHCMTLDWNLTMPTRADISLLS